MTISDEMTIFGRVAAVFRIYPPSTGTREKRKLQSALSHYGTVAWGVARNDLLIGPRLEFSHIIHPNNATVTSVTSDNNNQRISPVINFNNRTRCKADRRDVFKGHNINKNEMPTIAPI